MSSNLSTQKWQKFLKRAWPFQYIPFIDFVFVAGSLATGNMREESDFDVIVGVRQGRIFIVRAICILFFGALGLRAVHKSSNSKRWRDKLCFNHFVTPNSYRLSPPYNDYWKKLYLSLAPVYGDPTLIQKFYRANSDWLGESRLYQEDGRHIYKKSVWIKRALEWMLSGGFGDWLERRLKILQMKRIKKKIKSQSGYKPRITYSDDELEFHPDTKRIDDFLQK